MDESGRKKQVGVREPPSVPFLWEVRPGIPKKDWKPEASSSSVPEIPKAPIKLIASVPFAWEEKPGKPIPRFSRNAEAKLIDMASSSSSSGYSVACKESTSDSNYEDGSDSDDSMIGMELEAFGFEKDESFGCSDPSLLANCLVASSKISTAIPLQKNSLIEQNSEQLESAPSPASETGSSTSSYETGRSSLVGASFLERLFPLFPPNSSFLEKAGSSTPPQLKSRDFDAEDNTSVMVRRPPTLGELIMMSRRRSYRRKAVQMKKWDLQRNITTKEAFGCFMFASGSKMIEGFLKRKYLSRLKLAEAGWFKESSTGESNSKTKSSSAY